jgi:hypothetical protein
MSVLYVGAYSYSLSSGAYGELCTASVTTTHVSLLSIMIKRSSFENSEAFSSKCYLHIFEANGLTRFEITESGLESPGVSYGANVSSFVGCDLTVFRVRRRIVAVCHASQVYGGAISAMVGPFVRSFMGYGSSSALCGTVICDKCGLLIDGVSIQNSLALSSTSGTLPAPSLFFVISLRECAV